MLKEDPIPEAKEEEERQAERVTDGVLKETVSHTAEEMSSRATFIEQLADLIEEEAAELRERIVESTKRGRHDPYLISDLRAAYRKRHRTDIPKAVAQERGLLIRLHYKQQESKKEKEKQQSTDNSVHQLSFESDERLSQIAFPSPFPIRSFPKLNPLSGVDSDDYSLQSSWIDSGALVDGRPSEKVDLPCQNILNQSESQSGVSPLSVNAEKGEADLQCMQPLRHSLSVAPRMRFETQLNPIRPQRTHGWFTTSTRSGSEMWGGSQIEGESPEAARPFHRHATVLSRLSYPNLVPLIAVRVGDGKAEDCRVLQVTPWCPQPEGRLSESAEWVMEGGITEGLGGGDLKERVQVASDIVSALAFLHQKGFVHGDLRCENVFLTKRGRGVLGFNGTRDADKKHANLLREAAQQNPPTEEAVRPLSYSLCHSEANEEFDPEGIGLGPFLPTLSESVKAEGTMSGDVFSAGIILSDLLGGGGAFGEDAERAAALKDLVGRMCSPVVADRPAAADVLRHPLFQTDSLSGEVIGEETEEAQCIGCFNLHSHTAGLFCTSPVPHFLCDSCLSSMTLTRTHIPSDAPPGLFTPEGVSLACPHPGCPSHFFPPSEISRRISPDISAMRQEVGERVGGGKRKTDTQPDEMREGWRHGEDLLQNQDSRKRSTGGSHTVRSVLGVEKKVTKLGSECACDSNRLRTAARGASGLGDEDTLSVSDRQSHGQRDIWEGSGAGISALLEPQSDGHCFVQSSADKGSGLDSVTVESPLRSSTLPFHSSDANLKLGERGAPTREAPLKIDQGRGDTGKRCFVASRGERGGGKVKNESDFAGAERNVDRKKCSDSAEFRCRGLSACFSSLLPFCIRH
uniref:non-specific serine/threonine protein kinase n=1 Tax=Chromera velia CCMP2878 TaxID=1169474 RepID=A0A0G4HS95_9ALVE|eukprot:Cvel_8245.t1-p1 / transcript=Cvel_8245.t1 / gene=Cvel_8245 / organism=Chromera_velia_CCMP2878 / gene_product=hypothetical protein / transcript_product=hypothetical protein / location=Cvel_scaffold451:18875-21445(-) / protein_length=857 / sequence_SO=supercontig / SO=protein_coding / is_pseudo=false